MRPSPMLAIIIGLLCLAGCAGPAAMPTPSPTFTPAAHPACRQPGTTGTDSVPFPGNAESYFYTVYWPPCYAGQSGSAYPVLYWTNGYGQNLFDTADRLIGQGDVPPFIIIVLAIDPNKGYGADAYIVETVVPTIDLHYRTQADPLHRSITGISHGAAIALRAAFRPPQLFGRVAVLSGGIADGEQEKFTSWIAGMPPGRRPAVLIDVGDQDGILNLTHHLTALLDGLGYPYTFTHAPGDHDAGFWDSRLADYLKWLVPAD